MKAASVKVIKDELHQLSQSDLTELCLKLVKYKKENKELLSYLLFDAIDEPGYVASIKESLHTLFTEVNVKSVYITKKNLRRIIKVASKYIKYSSDPETEVQVLFFICEEINSLGLNLLKSPALLNIFTSVKNRLHKAILDLHEDLQYDYLRLFEKLS